MNENSKCPICGGKTVKQNAVFSNFIKERVFDNVDVSTDVLICENCGFQYSSYRYNEMEVQKLYNGYRNEHYQKQRQRYDVWYTPQINALIGKNDTEIKNRVKNMINILERNIPNGLKSIEKVLDWGGDKGQFIPKQIKEKYLYDISNVECVEGVSVINPYETNKDWDLVMCCHVLEHLANPIEVLESINSIMQKDKYLYVELPYELGKSNIFSNVGFLFNKYFSWKNIIKHYINIKKLGACRIISEHINFYTPEAISKQLENCGFKVVEVSVNKINQEWCKGSIISVLAYKI